MQSPNGYCIQCISLVDSSQEEKSAKKVADEKVVKLIAQLPPIDKMDAGLAALAHVE